MGDQSHMDESRVPKLPPIGNTLYQKKAVQAIIQDHDFAEQISDVMEPEFFKERYLKEIVSLIFSYKEKYNSIPSFDVMFDIVDAAPKREEIGAVIADQMVGFLNEIKDKPLNGDMGYVQDKAIDFCRRHSLLEGINLALNEIESGDFDSVYKTITDAASKGAARDDGHEYLTSLDQRTEQAIRDPMPTPWPVLNGLWGGGPDKGALVSFVAPTGVGKTHFLCNVAADAIRRGYNVVYVTLEIAEFKIGLRLDAYFSGIEINSIYNHKERVAQELEAAEIPGRLFIKEYPTKGATVQTIRSYLKRLNVSKGFEPDIIIIDYATLLKVPVLGDKHDYETLYGELRGLADEWGAIVYTADQTNRGGLDQEIVVLGQIADMYNRMTVCDAIITISRTNEDRERGTGRVLIAKSRFGGDGLVLPFKMDSSRCRIEIVDERSNVTEAIEEDEENKKALVTRRFMELTKTRFPVHGEND